MLAEKTTEMSRDERSEMAKMLMTLFEHWHLASDDQLALLGLATNNRAALARYRHGEPLGASRDLLDRAGNLFAIHKSLRLLFPQNRNLAYQWMSQRNRAFGGLTPTEVVKARGFVGLLMVRGYLDRARGQ